MTNFSGSGWSGGYIFVNKAVTNANIITARVYVPVGGISNYGVSLYLQDKNWGWYESPSVNPTPGQWKTITWNLAGLGFATPTNRIGLHVGSNSAYQGCLYFDSVDVTTP
ncbi:hypothetical protein A2619_00160 [candidate division WWE3 bacterium RIFOXYD1_FULL_39_9]|nr:MAG: hypothetical protein A2619_00160 [candidate division WWE3 bacterium RIFOXYD1_FULL_39_9]